MPFRLTIRMTAPETKEKPVRYARQLIATLAGLLAAVFLVILACHTDRGISTDIWIDSPPQEVWQVLTTTRDYPSWNPMIARVNGPRVASPKFVTGCLRDDVTGAAGARDVRGVD
jgi:hypothetical protein